MSVPCWNFNISNWPTTKGKQSILLPNKLNVFFFCGGGGGGGEGNGGGDRSTSGNIRV